MALPINIEDLLNKRKVESNRIEFKARWNPDKIYHTVCAFATDLENTGGGYILVGIEEENGVAKRPVKGLNEKEIDDILKNMVGYDAKIEPTYMTKVSTEIVDGKPILVIWAPSGLNRPYSVMNALYHRDYQEHEPVEITVEPTHVDILSYAGPDRSISSDAIKAAKKLKARRYRNRRLGDFLKELDLTEGRATGIPTIQKALKDNGSAPATIETDDDRTYFLMTIPCREGFARKLSQDDFDVNNGWTNRLGQTLGQTSVQVQEIIKQSVITDKEQLGQLLEQLIVKVWNKSKRKEDIPIMSEYVINILSLLKENTYSASSLISILDFGDLKDFKRKLLNPMISLGYIGMLYPDKPTSAKQAYQLTAIGLKLFGS